MPVLGEWPLQRDRPLEDWASLCEPNKKAIHGTHSTKRDWQSDAVTVIERARLEALERQCERLTNQLESITRDLAALREACECASFQPYTTPMTTFAPEPYELTQPVHLVIQSQGGVFTASFVEANISASGDTEYEAIQMVKDMILAAFDWLSATDDRKLGPGPLTQKRILTSLMRETKAHNG